jgi:hypothetical protein
VRIVQEDCEGSEEASATRQLSQAAGGAQGLSMPQL